MRTNRDARAVRDGRFPFPWLWTLGLRDFTKLPQQSFSLSLFTHLFAEAGPRMLKKKKDLAIPQHQIAKITKHYSHLWR